MTRQPSIIRCFCGRLKTVRAMRCGCEGSCGCGETRCDLCAGHMEPRPTRFRLIGQTTEFEVVKRYLAADFIPSVVGQTADDRKRTVARVADVIWLGEG